MEITVRYIKLTIEGEWEGAYFPATRETPEEHPEFDIHAVYLYGSDEDIFGILSESFIAEIYDEINNI
jgi:hypothetical protein